MADLNFKSFVKRREGQKIVFEVEFDNLESFGEDYATRMAAKIVSVLSGKE